MLVFFIHGVATRNSNYADELKDKLKEEFANERQALPYFYSSLWGGILDNGSQRWNWVQQDLNNFEKQYQIGVKDVFQYSQYREFFITHFFGDLFTYLNSECGKKIRKTIASQLLEFLRKHPEENELHIIAHSLGGVIIWDILFSEKFSSDDPAFEIREVIKGLSASHEKRKVYLRSITTMGTPILLFNLMLDVDPQRIKIFASRYLGKPLRWINIIHASDVLAYPIRASLNIDSSSNLFLRDKFIGSHNFIKKIAQPLGQLAGLSMAKGLASSHSSYWQRTRVARLIRANILGDCDFIDSVNPFREWF
ncbi:hypothetical protein [Phormidium nigroviride]